MVIRVLRLRPGRGPEVVEMENSLTPGIVKRTFAPGAYAKSLTAPAGPTNEIALASPEGVEPSLAT